MTILADMALALASGAVRVVDLTHRLDPDFPVIILPPEFGPVRAFPHGGGCRPTTIADRHGNGTTSP